jgi:hypothetical protein
LLFEREFEECGMKIKCDIEKWAKMLKWKCEIKNKNKKIDLKIVAWLFFNHIEKTSIIMYLAMKGT